MSATDDESKVTTPQEAKNNIYVVSDSAGFVGAFTAKTLAEELVLLKYVLVPFAVQCFPAAPGPANSVWVVPYTENDAVAFVSNSRDDAVAAQKVYAKIGLVYTDDVDYWEQPMNKIAASALTRLDAQQAAHNIYASDAVDAELHRLQEDDQKRLDTLTTVDPEGPMMTAIRENERTTIFDCVVAAQPVSNEPVADPPVDADSAEEEPIEDTSSSDEVTDGEQIHTGNPFDALAD